ncbi:MAG: tetratricopeptide repeat protein, partial [Pseudomonadota bacterium]
EGGDIATAAQAYAQVLQSDPENVKALGGLARCYPLGGEPERAQQVLDMAGPDAKDPDLDAVRAGLALAADAPSETAEFERRLAADPDDHQARLDLAKALAGHGRFDAAADHLLHIIERDRAWNDEAARKQLLTIFEAAGPGSEVARSGRRRLSAILFS